MKKSVLALWIVASLATSGTGRAASEDAPIWKEVDGWSLRVDTTIGYGCFLMAEFEKGTILRFGFLPEAKTMYVMLADNDWKSLEVGKEYALQLKMGREDAWDAPAKAIDMSGTTVLFVTTDKVQFLREFMEQTNFTASYDGEVITQLSLRGTANAGRELIACQEVFAETNGAAQKTGRDPFAKGTESRDPFAK